MRWARPEGGRHGSVPVHRGSGTLAPMVVLSRVWTGTGDDGTTSLGDGTRTTKTDARLVAFADVDETGAALGLVLVALPGGEGVPARVREVVRRVQNDLFDVGADLCLPLGARVEHEPLRVQEPWVSELEQDMDALNETLPTLRSFVLAGGSPAAAHLHLARTVARRAERSVWRAIEEHGTGDGGVNPLTARYLNRLSDLLFVLARAANSPDLGGEGDVLWQPGGGRAQDPSRP